MEVNFILSNHTNHGRGNVSLELMSALPAAQLSKFYENINTLSRWNNPHNYCYEIRAGIVLYYQIIKPPKKVSLKKRTSLDRYPTESAYTSCDI